MLPLILAQYGLSTSLAISSTERLWPVGTATMICPAPAFLTASMAARRVEPAAMPSSTRMTGRSFNGGE